jgi:hypothetical protein
MGHLLGPDDVERRNREDVVLGGECIEANKRFLIVVEEDMAKLRCPKVHGTFFGSHVGHLSKDPILANGLGQHSDI